MCGYLDGDGSATPRATSMAKVWTRYLCAKAPSETMEPVTKAELLDAAAEKLVEVAKLLDRADEDRLADDALELAERVNLRISLN